MTIEFLELESVAGIGQGGGIGFVLRGEGRAVGIAPGHGAGGLSFYLRGEGTIEGGGDLGDPDLPAGGHLSLDMAVGGQGSSHVVGEGGGIDIEPRLGGRAGQGGGLTIEFAVGGRELPPTPPANYGFFVFPPPVLSGYGNLWFERVTERLVFRGAAGAHATLVMREFVAFLAQVRAPVEGLAAAAATVAFGSRMDFVFRAMVAEGIAFGSEISIDQRQIARVAARLVLGGHASTYSEAMASILDALVLQGGADAIRSGAIADSVVFGDWIEAAFTAFAAALDQVVFADSAAGTQSLVAIVSERLVLSGALDTDVETTAVLRDAIGFMATFRIDDGEYVAWVLNARNTALSRYTNYPFNSFAKIGNRYYGAAADGVHRLEGEDDNGEDIRWRIRLGLQDLGTRRLKRLPEMFIGYASSGTLLLKAIVSDEESGEKSVAIYRMATRGAASVRENRVKLGQGLKSVDWDFELEGVDGASIDLKSVEFRPVFLERRTRG